MKIDMLFLKMSPLHKQHHQFDETSRPLLENSTISNFCCPAAAVLLLLPMYGHISLLLSAWNFLVLRIMFKLQILILKSVYSLSHYGTGKYFIMASKINELECSYYNFSLSSSLGSPASCVVLTLRQPTLTRFLTILIGHGLLSFSKGLWMRT